MPSSAATASDAVCLCQACSMSTEVIAAGHSTMSFLDHVGVLILTYNEAANIGRTLDALVRFPEVVVLDSGSTDDPLAIAARYANTRTIVRPFDTHAAQWSHGLRSCGLTQPWVLALDADYVVSAALVDEIAQLRPEEAVSGYRAAFRYCVHG